MKPKEERRLLRGHRWAYRNEFADLPEMEDGDVVDVYAKNGRFVGRGFFQAQGGIAVRLLTPHQRDIDEAFLRESVDAARAFRETIYPGQDVYRWVFGESDGLPGLVADRYAGVVSAQSSCRFYGRHADAVGAALLAEDGVEGVRLAVCGAVHEYGQVTSPLEVSFDGIRMSVDVNQGQKTGMFLDQRENAAAVGRYAAGRRVLDGHCYTGLWSCHAAKAGAASVLGVDTSATALDAARHNAELNGVGDTCTFECTDIADVLQRDVQYGLVMLDPPGLAKGRAQRERALGVYHAINRDAMKIVEPGGYLITSSCSHFVTPEAFTEMLKRSARSAQREAWVVEVRGAAADHPVLMAMPETSYLVCAALRVM